MDGSHLHKKWSRPVLEGGCSQVIAKLQQINVVVIHVICSISAIGEGEKAVIRTTLLQCIEEPVPQVR